MCSRDFNTNTIEPYFIVYTRIRIYPCITHTSEQSNADIYTRAN